VIDMPLSLPRCALCMRYTGILLDALSAGAMVEVNLR
jgi:hypothetical protein